jgi:glycosyltransferase involved in cell wall biosynthesis
MRIAFLSEWDVSNPDLRSGVPYQICKNLKELGHEVSEIRVDYAKIKPTHRFFEVILNIIFNKILGKKLGFYNSFYDQWKAKSIALQIENQLNTLGNKIDLILSINSYYLSHLNTKIPIICWIDNSYKTFIDNINLTKMPNFLTERIMKIDMMGLSKCHKIHLASDWLKEQIISDYGLDTQKMDVTFRGASLIGYKNLKDSHINLENKISNEKCNILFVCTNWKNKGGDKVIETCKVLEIKKINFSLTIIGKIPTEIHSEINSYQWIDIKGRLNKSNPIELDKYISEFKKTHFLFIPTLADGFGITYAEASTFGVPSIGTDTMGVKSSIENNVNGIRFEIDENPEKIASYIIETFSDKEKYRKLAISSFEKYERDFQWKLNCKKVLDSGIIN